MVQDMAGALEVGRGAVRVPSRDPLAGCARLGRRRGRISEQVPAFAEGGIHDSIGVGVGPTWAW